MDSPSKSNVIRNDLKKMLFLISYTVNISRTFTKLKEETYDGDGPVRFRQELHRLNGITEQQKAPQRN